MRHAGWVALWFCIACAHDVPADRATGPDGKLKGAKALVVTDGEANARGIVTYPGGDRIDWKRIDLPAGKRGTLDLELTWQAPRPGLQVSFDVFNEWNQPVKAQKASASKRGRNATIDDASGKYFVRIYAPRRGDAGEYKLHAQFEQSKEEDEQKQLKEQLAKIPDPPKLPSVPEPGPVCEPFDVANKACKTVCPDFGAPAGWPPCAEKERLAKEKAEREAAEKNKPPPPKPVMARIIDTKTVASSSQVILATGTDHAPIDTTWVAEVLSAQTGKPLVGGTLILVRVGKTQTVAKSSLTIDQLTANAQVRLSPPAKP